MSMATFGLRIRSISSEIAVHSAGRVLYRGPKYGSNRYSSFNIFIYHFSQAISKASLVLEKLWLDELNVACLLETSSGLNDFSFLLY
jgi:hypothetical protein